MTWAIRVGLGFIAALACGVAAWAADEPRPIVVKGIEAIGGEGRAVKLEKARATLKAKVTQGETQITITETKTLELPGRLKSSQQIRLPDQELHMVEVVDGDHGWIKDDHGRVVAINDRYLAEIKESLYTTRVESLLPLLHDKAFTLTALGEGEVGGRPALGVKVSCAGHADIELYFDKETGLLAKLRRTSLDRAVMREVRQDTFFSDYRQIDGLKRPMKLVIYINGRKTMECDVTECRFVDKFDDAEFAKP